MRHLATTAVLAAIGIALPVVARSVELQASGDGQSHRPDEPIVFALSGAEPGLFERLAFEVDDVDVTSFALSEGTTVTLHMPTPLTPGEHGLRVVEWAADGSLVERGAWTLEVRQSSLFRERTLDASVSADGIWRAARHDLDGPTDHPGQLRGAAIVNGRVATESGSISASAPILFDGEAGGLSPGTRRDWDLGAFLVEANRGPSSLRLGHFAPAPSSLILENFHRRGAAFGLELEDLRSSLTAWSLRSEPITGFREGLGLSDGDQRINGVTLTGQPFEIPGGVLDLAGTWLQGRSADPGLAAGLAFAGPHTQREGSAWSARADALFADQRVRVRGEYASTRFDPFDGGLGGANSDDAWSLLVAVAPWNDLTIGDYSVRTDLSFEIKQVGPLFRSVGNPGAPVDRRFEELRLGANWGGFDGRFSFTRERDNVDDLEFLPQFQTDRYGAEFSYTPWFQEPPPDWMGQPMVSLSAFHERLEPRKNPSGPALTSLLGGSLTVITNDLGVVLNAFPGAAFLDPTAGPGGTPALVPANAFFDPYGPVPSFELSDRLFRSVSALVGSSYQWGSWSVGHTIEAIDDLSGQTPDGRTQLTSANTSFRVGEQVFVGLGLQRQKERFHRIGYQRSTWLLNGNLTWTIVPEKLDGSLQASMTRSYDNTFTTDSRFMVVSGRLDWLAIEAQRSHPGLRISLFGTWSDVDDDVSRFQIDTFQAFLQATLEWQGGLQ